MNTEHIDIQIVGCDVQFIEDLIQRHSPSILGLVNVHVAGCLHFLLHESQQMLLVHRRGTVNVRVDLAHVVEIPVRRGFHRRPFLDLVEQPVHFEFRLQILQTTVAEGFQRTIDDHRGEQDVIVIELISVNHRIVSRHRGIVPVQPVDTVNASFGFDVVLDRGQ